MDPVATIDVGTNSMLLLVARLGDRGQLIPLVDRATVTRLGRGVDRDGRLSAEGIEAGIRTLRDYVEQARATGASAIRAVGTSALRDADNAASFLEPAEGILGTPVEVITGTREAELTFLGSLEGIELPDGDVTIVDVGGGSTEIVRGRARSVLEATSLDVGSVRLFERHLRDDPPTSEQLAHARADIRRLLDASTVKPASPLVGIAGTVTTVACLIREIDPYDPDRVHGLHISTDEIARLTETLAGMPVEDRKSLPGLDPARADVIPAGALLLLELAEAAAATEVIVSNGGVRVGLAMELLEGSHAD